MRWITLTLSVFLLMLCGLSVTQANAATLDRPASTINTKTLDPSKHGVEMLVSSTQSSCIQDVNEEETSKILYFSAWGAFLLLAIFIFATGKEFSGASIFVISVVLSLIITTAVVLHTQSLHSTNVQPHRSSSAHVSTI